MGKSWRLLVKAGKLLERGGVEMDMYFSYYLVGLAVTYTIRLVDWLVRRVIKKGPSSQDQAP